MKSMADELLKIEVDFAYDEDELDKGVARFVESAKVDASRVWWRVVQYDGPSGGWPVIEFVVPREHAFALALAYCGGDAVQAGEEVLVYAVPVA